MTVAEKYKVCLAPSPRLRDGLTDFTQFSRIYPHIVYNETRPIRKKGKLFCQIFTTKSNYQPDKTYYECLLYITLLDFM